MDEEEYLAHYGTKGMKWGVRKSDYKAMSRDERKLVRRIYRQTAKGQLERNTKIGTYLGGPVIGAAVGGHTNKKISQDKFKNRMLQDQLREEKEFAKNAGKKGQTIVQDLFDEVYGHAYSSKYSSLNEVGKKEIDDIIAQYSRDRYSLKPKRNSKKNKKQSNSAKEDRPYDTWGGVKYGR